MVEGIESAFSDLLEQLRELHDRKGADYDGGIRYGNVRGSTEFGVPAWIGAMIRANDKMLRLQKFARLGRLVNESVEDSFLDLCVYVGIAYILWREASEMKREEVVGPIVGDSRTECSSLSA